MSIPADANPADNDFWFVFEQPAPRRTVVVVDDPQAARPLAAGRVDLAGPVAEVYRRSCHGQSTGGRRLGPGVAPACGRPLFPTPRSAKQVQAFVDRGGSAIFFPAHVPGAGELFGVRWTSWVDQKAEAPVESWRGDEDLLAHTASGQPLPVGQLQIRKYCGLSGEVTPLATLRGGAPLLARVTTSRGSAYFCATTPAPADSSLATSGVVFYVLVQRALAGGRRRSGQHAAAHGRRDRRATTRPCGSGWPAPRRRSRPISRFTAVSTRTANGCWPSIAPPAKRRRRCWPTAAWPSLFQGLDFARVDDKAGSIGSLIQEIWRLFLVAMMVAMVAEAALCLPKVARAAWSCSMSVSRSLTFLGTPWSVAAVAPGRARHRGALLCRLAAQRLSTVDGVARALAAGAGRHGRACCSISPNGSRSSARRKSRRSRCSGTRRPAWTPATSSPPARRRRAADHAARGDRLADRSHRRGTSCGSG